MILYTYRFDLFMQGLSEKNKFQTGLFRISL